MKLRKITTLLVLIAYAGCAPDDFTGDPTPPDPENEAPFTFKLKPITDDDQADLQPIFSWEAAVDPDGDKVTYDVVVDTKSVGAITVVENIEETSYTLADPLFVSTDYEWNVIAKDEKGGSTESNANGFTTRGINNFLLVKNAEFSKRRAHRVVEYKEVLWLIGGRAVNGFTSEVWSSLDGVVWEAVTSNAAFGDLNSFTTTVFNDRIWVIAGAVGNTNVQNKVWSSNNGIDWVLETDDPGFSARHLHSTEVFDGKLWVIGGYDGNQRKNDVWSSSDGVVWENVVEKAPFTAREEHASVVFDNKLWVIGGNDGVNKNDVWASENGADWNLVAENPPFAPRQQHTATAYAGKIWIIAGSSGNDIWYSDDGVKWTKAVIGEEFNAISRSLHSTTLANGKLYVIGGDGTGLKNDVWIFD